MTAETSFPDLLRRVSRSVRQEAAGSADVVHLHLFAFGGLMPLVPTLRAYLSPDEEQRVRRFRAPEDGLRFACGRGMLRWLLGAFVDRSPRSLPIEYSPAGRPALSGADLDFNLAHTREYLVIAVSRRGPLGVDVEGTSDVHDALGIARRFFAPAEYVKLARLAGEARTRAFVRGWTQKEAYIKAHGLGLSMPLDRFQVALLPDEPSGLMASELGEEEVQRWHFFESDALPGVHTALAVAGADVRVRVWNWTVPVG